MRRRKRSRTSPAWYVVVPLAVSGVALLLPRAWTGKLFGLVQVVLPIQHALSDAADRIVPPSSSVSSAVPAVAPEEHTRRIEALEHQNAALMTRAFELEQEVQVLTASRTWTVGQSRLGAAGRLIPAKVVAEDVVPWRSSRSIDAGALQGVRPGMAVTSRHFTIDRGEQAGIRPGLAILLGEVLIGFVDQVGSTAARVKMLSDVTTGRKVRLARPTGQGIAVNDRTFWLVGRGRGEMQIRDVDRRDIESGVVQIGDIVLSDPMDDVLPAAMTIGKLVSAESDPRNPLLAILSVSLSLDERALRRVYVFDPETAADGNAGTTPGP